MSVKDKPTIPDTTPVGVVVHGRQDCPHCARVKAFLQEQDVPYLEVLHEEDAERQEFYNSLGLVNEPGEPPQRTVPQVIVVEESGESILVGDADATIRSGIRSLFHPVKVSEADRAEYTTAAVRRET